MGGLTPPRPLTAGDARQAFDCGRESLNLWLRQHAWRNQQAGTSRTSIICDDTGTIAGYVSLCAAQVQRAYLPKPMQRNAPDPLPALLLGQLAVDRTFQRQGCARSLLLFALKTAVRISMEIGCFAALTHPLDDDVRDFYKRFGFETLPFDPRRSMAVRIADLVRNGF